MSLDKETQKHAHSQRQVNQACEMKSYTTYTYTPINMYSLVRLEGIKGDKSQNNARANMP